MKLAENYTEPATREALITGRSQIAEQNQNVELAQANLDSDFLSIVLGAVQEEQAKALERLIEIGESIPYEQIAERNSSLLSIIDELSTQADTETLAIEKEAELAKEITGYNKLAGEKIDAIVTQKKSTGVFEQLDSHQKELERLEDELDVLGQAWPIPRALEAQVESENDEYEERDILTYYTNPVEMGDAENLLDFENDFEYVFGYNGTDAPGAESKTEAESVVDLDIREQIANFFLQHVHQVVASPDIRYAFFGPEPNDEYRSTQRAAITRHLSEAASTKDEDSVTNVLKQFGLDFYRGRQIRHYSDGTTKAYAAYYACPANERPDFIELKEEHPYSPPDEVSAQAYDDYNSDEERLDRYAELAESAGVNPYDDEPRSQRLNGKLFKVVAPGAVRINFESLAFSSADVKSRSALDVGKIRGIHASTKPRSQARRHIRQLREAERTGSRTGNIEIVGMIIPINKPDENVKRFT